MRCMLLTVYQMLLAQLLTGAKICFCIVMCTSTMCSIDYSSHVHGAVLQLLASSCSCFGAYRREWPRTTGSVKCVPNMCQSNPPRSGLAACILASVNAGNIASNYSTTQLPFRKPAPSGFYASNRQWMTRIPPQPGALLQAHTCANTSNKREHPASR